MKNIFPAVFSSVWKRKETKIYLAFALFSLIYLVASFFGKSNFMQITTFDDYKISAIDFLDMMMSAVDGFMLPTLAIYFLTISVFKREVDDHTMFLYRDLNRSKVFIAKYLSLISIVSVFYLMFFVTSTGVFYLRVVHMSIASNAFLPGLQEAVLSNFLSLLGFFMKDIFSVTIATVISLYFSTGATMVTAVVLSLTMMIMPIIGGPGALLFPNGYSSLLSTNPMLAFSGTVGITVFYATIFVGIGIKKFKSLEF